MFQFSSHLLEPVSLQPFQPVVSPPPSAIAGWMSGANHSIPHAAVAAGPPGIVQAPTAGQYLSLLFCFIFSG